MHDEKLMELMNQAVIYFKNNFIKYKEQSGEQTDKQSNELSNEQSNKLSKEQSGEQTDKQSNEHYIKGGSADAGTDNSIKGAGLDSDSKGIGCVHIYSHLDTDGLTAAAIMGKALLREGIGYQISILKQLEEQYFISEIQRNATEFNQFLIFTDFGSGQLNLFEKYIPQSRFIILDHHEILKDDSKIENGANNKEIAGRESNSAQKLDSDHDTNSGDHSKSRTENNPYKISGFQVNPYMVGVNGSNEISGAGMAYLFDLALNKENKNLSDIAIVGALGDLQDQAPKKMFLGENKEILNDAEDANLIEIESEPAIARSKPLTYSLAYHLKIQLPMIYHNIKNAANFLKKIGINTKNDLGEERTLADLSKFDKKKLTSELVRTCLENGIEQSKLAQLLQTNYLLRDFKSYSEIYDGRDFARMLNACGRLNMPSVGISVCISKNPDNIREAILTMNKYTELLKTGINWVTDEKKLVKMDNIQYFYGNNMINENIIGVICSSLVNSPDISKSKPVIGYADSDEGYYKVSARCKNKLIKHGVNLSTAIREVSKRLGISERGGGHPPASGAKVPVEKMNRFLTTLDEVIGEQKKEFSKKEESGLGGFLQ